MSFDSLRNNDQFYDRTGWWWGNTRISETDRRRAALIDTVENGPHSVLELGAGWCGTAAATADLGHHVVAVERSLVRAALGRRHLLRLRPGQLKILEADFHFARIDGRFDIVAYWSGFGAGTDGDQHHLLERIRYWIKPHGQVFLDVFDPLWWSKADGVMRRLGSHLHQKLGFDPATQRLRVTYWIEGREQARVSESIRCYSPCELADLVRVAGLRQLAPPSYVAGDSVSYLVRLTAP